MTTEYAPKVGDVMILMVGESRPKTVNLSSVTKTGLVRFAANDGTESELFKEVGWGVNGSRYEPRTKVRYGRRSVLYPYSEVKLEELNKMVDRLETEAKDKEAARLANLEAREARLAAELVSTKAACGNELPVVSAVDAGSYEVVTMLVPTLPERAERHGERLVVVVRLAWREENDWTANSGSEKVKRLYTGLTYTKADDAGSWPSVSADSYPDRETALWNAARYARYSW